MNKDIRLEGSLASFTYTGLGKNSNESFSGEFTVKCFLSPIETVKADKLYREMLGEISPQLASRDAENVAFALSQLKYRVVKFPAGWKNNEIDGGHLDINIVIEILNIAIEAQVMFKNKAKERLQDLQTTLTAKINEGEIKESEELLPDEK